MFGLPGLGRVDARARRRRRAARRGGGDGRAALGHRRAHPHRPRPPRRRCSCRRGSVGAYFFTSSTSFANPAVTVGRAFTDTFTGIAPRVASPASSLVPARRRAAAGARRWPALLLARPVRPRVTATRHDRHKPSVLFVCVHNAGRSQMAAAYLTHLAGAASRCARRARRPADAVNPAVVEAMAEEGIDIAAEVPKVLTTDAVQASDVVITMGCGDACPIFPGKRYEDWVLDDPAGQGVDAVRPIRDEIRRRVEALLRELESNPSRAPWVRVPTAGSDSGP